MSSLYMYKPQRQIIINILQDLGANSGYLNIIHKCIALSFMSPVCINIKSIYVGVIGKNLESIKI